MKKDTSYSFQSKKGMEVTFEELHIRHINLLIDVKNKDLWLDLYECISFHVVNWKWVKGHSGDTLNEEVDKIARGEAEKIIDS